MLSSENCVEAAGCLTFLEAEDEKKPKLWAFGLPESLQKMSKELFSLLSFCSRAISSTSWGGSGQ